MSLAIEKKIEGKLLEVSQKEAILESGENILVNAGAGSGKTFTILAKILHILDQDLAKPEEIVVVAYNSSVANDLRARFEKIAEVFGLFEYCLTLIHRGIEYLNQPAGNMPIEMKKFYPSGRGGMGER